MYSILLASKEIPKTELEQIKTELGDSGKILNETGKEVCGLFIYAVESEKRLHELIDCNTVKDVDFFEKNGDLWQGWISLKGKWFLAIDGIISGTLDRLMEVVNLNGR